MRLFTIEGTGRGVRFASGALVLALAGGLAAACGDDGAEGGDERQSTKSASTPTPTPPKTQLSVPARYDTSRGWETNHSGLYPLPLSKTIAVYQGSETEGRFIVHDIATGKVLWSTAKMTVEEGWVMDGLSVTAGDREYLVITSSGITDEDVVNKGRTVTRLDIFDVNKDSGNVVKPTRHVEVDGRLQARDGGAGILLEHEVGTGEDDFVVVDPASGATETYDPPFDPPASCEECKGGELVGLTPSGPLFHSYSLDLFWQLDGWVSRDVLPGGDSHSVRQADEDHLVTGWPGEAGDVWAVLDSTTATVEAEVECPADAAVPPDEVGELSPNGRYLDFDYVVFDLEQGTGRCFAETEETKAIQFTTVLDDGTAFGWVDLYGDDPKVVEVDITDGSVEESKAEKLPRTEIDGYGIFSDEGTLVVYPRKK